MFKVSRQTSISCDGSPPIAFHHNIRSTNIDHRLNGNHHSFSQAYSSSCHSVIRNWRVFMQSSADTMANKLSYDRESVSFHSFLYSCRYVTDPVPDAGPPNTAL